MKIEASRECLDRNRPMAVVTLRMPENIVNDLKRLAPRLGFSGYQPLMRAYVRQKLAEDLERLESGTVSALVASLERRGVSADIIAAALSEATHA